MNHDVFYLREAVLDRIVNLLRDTVGGAYAERAVNADFYVYVDLVAENPGAQQVDLLNALDFFGAGFDFRFGFLIA